MTTPSRQRAILFAYDGSDQAKAGIREAAAQLRPSSRALVLTVWQPQPSAALPFASGAGVPSDLEDASVIVMGSHGRTASRALLGGVATAVSSHGDRPLLNRD